MDSFDQLMKLAHEANESYKNFLSKNLDVAADEAFMNYFKSQEICKDIADKIDKVEIRQEEGGYGYAKCAYYMAKDSLNSYQYAALLVFTRKLGEAFIKLIEKKSEEQQKESFKHLIKEAIKEAREQEQKTKLVKPKKHSSKKDI